MNLEMLGISKTPMRFALWVRVLAVATFGYLAFVSAIDVFQGDLYGLFFFLIATFLTLFFALGRSLKPDLTVIIIFGTIAALLGAVVAGLFWVLWGGLVHGEFLFTILTLPIFLFASVFPAVILALPMMKLRRYVAEPYYFLLFVIAGFIAGVLVMVIFQGGNPIKAFSYAGWKLFGAFGAIYATASWRFLRSTEGEWLTRE